MGREIINRGNFGFGEIFSGDFFAGKFCLGKFFLGNFIAWTQILPNKMSRPEVDRPICLLDNRYSTYMFVVPGPEVEFSYLLNLQKVGVIWPSLSGSLLYL